MHRDGRAVHLQPKAFDVLAYLVAARERVVSKDELLERLWPDEVVAETSLTFSIKAVRRALGDDGTAQRFVKTVHGHGYRFVAEIRNAGAARRGVAPGPTTRAGDDAAAARETTGSTPAARSRILLQTACTPFVGREEERRVLDGELRLALGGQTRTSFVFGDPGVGKTRLVAELAQAAEAEGAAVLVGRCYDGLPPAFWPWVQVLRSYAEQFGIEAARAAAAEGVRDLARLLPGLVEDDDSRQGAVARDDADAEQARLRLFDSVVAFLREACARGPLVVVLDDLHWADAASLLVLRHLMREMLDARLLVVGTYRHAEAERGGTLAELLGWMHRTRRSSRLHLHGLVDEDVALLVREISGSDPPPELVSTLGRMTDGNPFFVEEFCRDLADRGGSPGDPDAPTAIRVPEEVREVLLQRVRRLGDAAAEVLSAAAVLGHEFRFDDLLLTAGAEAVRTTIEAAEAGGLVHPRPDRPGVFRFAHALVAEVLQLSLPSLARAELHRRAGFAIEARGGDDPLLLATELARHFSAAAAVGETAKAFEYQRLAGHLQVERYAYEEAALHYERALEIARFGGCDDDERFELLLALARASFRAGNETRVRDLVLEAVEIARRAGSTGMLARAALRTAGLFPVTPAERIELLEEALAGLRAQPEADPRLLSGVLSALASGLYGSVDAVERREALLDEALRIARASGDRRTLVRVLTASHVALWRPRHLSRRLELAREHLAIAEQAADVVEQAGARTWYVPALIEHGEIAEADRQIDLVDRQAGESRMLVYRANALSFRAMRALTRGEFEEVEFLAQRSYEMARRYNETTASMTLWSQIYYLRREQDRLAEIEAGIRMFASQVPQVSWDWLALHLLCEDGRLAEARPMLDRMTDSRFEDALPPDAHIVSVAALFGLAEVAWRLKNTEAAGLLLPHLERYGRQWVTVGLGGVCLGSVLYARGLVLATLGRRDEAVADLEEAAEAHEAAGVTLPLLRTRAELATVLLGSRSRAGRARASELVAGTSAEAERLGLAQLLRVLAAPGH